MKGLKKLSPESEVIPLNACATAKYHHAPLPEQEPIKVSISCELQKRRIRSKIR